MHSLLLPILPLVVLLCCTPPAAAQTKKYVVKNSCPKPINLYIGGVLDSVLAVGGTVTKLLPVGAGFFYTDANGGNKDGTATRAGFLGENGNNVYYYIVKDVTAFNTGISITPSYPPDAGFCLVDSCTDINCPNAYPQPPTRFLPFNASSPTPPTPPNYSCPHTEASYTITFCPGGSFPTVPVVGRSLNPNGNPKKCMDVRGAVFANGTPVQIYDCNGTPAQKWLFNRGSTKVKLAAANFCLDVGTSPRSGVGMKIWQCYDNLPAQAWSYTSDNRLKVSGLNQCLDLTNGNLANSNRLQIWQCFAGNTNQVWTIGN